MIKSIKTIILAIIIWYILTLVYGFFVGVSGLYKLSSINSNLHNFILFPFAVWLGFKVTKTSFWGSSKDKEKFKSCHEYVSEYKDGEMNGQGTHTWPNGDKYIGEFKDGKGHGQGTYTYPDGTKDEGIWKDGNFLYENIVTSKDDENFCLEIGFKRFTPEFDNCVEKTAEKD